MSGTVEQVVPRSVWRWRYGRFTVIAVDDDGFAWVRYPASGARASHSIASIAAQATPVPQVPEDTPDEVWVAFDSDGMPYWAFTSPTMPHQGFTFIPCTVHKDRVVTP